MEPWNISHPGREVEQSYNKVATERSQIEERKEKISQALLDLEESKGTSFTGLLDDPVLPGGAPYTHCEIDLQVPLGPASSTIPFINHNPAPRNTYQVQMSKQSVGIYNRNYKNRFDNNVKVLVHPANPDIVTETFSLLGLDHHITGENCVMVFMPFPYTEEDSFVIKSSWNGEPFGCSNIQWLKQTLSTMVAVWKPLRNRFRRTTGTLDAIDISRLRDLTRAFL